MTTEKHDATGSRRRAHWSLAVILSAAAIAIGARITVPMDPVPMTLQTLAVLGAGGVLGWRAGAAAAALYLAAILAGAPLLADGASAAGSAFLELKSAGYVVGFVPAAAIAGLGPARAAAPSGARSSQPLALLGLLLRMLAAHAIILTVGAAWLARSIGASASWEHGVQPFLWGALVKSVIAAAIAARFRRIALHW